jgi:hypothetical protein
MGQTKSPKKGGGINLKKQLIWLLTGLVLVSLLVGCAPGTSTSSDVPPAEIWSGMPPVIVVSGSDYEMGYQCGMQIAPLIYHNHMLTWSGLVATYGEETTESEMSVWAYYLWEYNPGLKDWLEGMAAGCREMGYDVTALKLAAISLYPTQLWARPDSPYPEETGVEAVAQLPADVAGAEEYHSCSAFAAMGRATADGKPVVAVTKMVPLETAQCFILVAFPDEGPSFITAPQAGQPAANAGMNSAGFADVMTALWGPLAWSYPIEGYFAYLPEYCESVAEAKEYLESCPRGGVMGSVTMADAAGNITTFESNSADYAFREWGDSGEERPFLVQTNHFVNPAMQAYNPPNVATGDSWYRYATIFEYASKAAPGAIDFEFLKAVYRSDDWYDDATGSWHYNQPGSAGVNNAGVTQAILFPADLIAYFQIGTSSGLGFPGGATGEFVKVQLADNPAAVATNVKYAALGFYNEARYLLAKELNRDDSYLTYSVAQSLEEMLDEAALEYDRGMDRAAFASMAESEGKDVNEQVALWSAALTHYAKTQLYAQMVTTKLEALATAE